MANRQQVTRFATVIALTFITFLFLGNILPGSVGLNGIKSITHAPNTVPGTFVKPGSEQSRYAFVSFLGAEAAGNDTEDLSKDKYFTAVRVLAYQLLHSLETRTTHNYPFVVLVTPEVSEKKRQRLRQDGATIVEAASFDVAEWLVSENPRFASVVSKLRVFELTQFELVCFLDGDHVLTRPLDGVFEDPTVGIKTTATNPGNIIADETPLPDSYVFATVHEMNKAHTFPFSYEDGDWPWDNYFNAGFFVTKPSHMMMEYYKSLLIKPEQYFDPYLPEQNMLNHAHRPDGNMPWTTLGVEWNVHMVLYSDIESEVASLHMKWWEPNAEAELRFYLATWKGRMDGFWEGREGKDLS